MAQLWNEWKIWLPLGLLIWQAVLSLVDFALCGWDKRCARLGRRRVPERRLLGLAALGGAAGLWVGMYRFHHKTLHWYFVWGAPLLFAAHLALLGASVYFCLIRV